MSAIHYERLHYAPILPPLHHTAYAHPDLSQQPAAHPVKLPSLKLGAMQLLSVSRRPALPVSQPVSYPLSPPSYRHPTGAAYGSFGTTHLPPISQFPFLPLTPPSYDPYHKQDGGYTSAATALAPLQPSDHMRAPLRALVDVASTARSDNTANHNPPKQQRKKRQCPECKLLFSNLATHKSTHLTPDSRPHVCSICDRGFSRSNDLSRHVKRHWKETGSEQGAFRCPFSHENYENHESHDSHDSHSSPESHKSHGLSPGLVDAGKDGHSCHPTGIFSRCDTFKNHLKALHFEYPSGTKKSQRGHVAGCCKSCKAPFTKVDDWVTDHVEAGLCPFGADRAPVNPHGDS